MTVTPIDLFGTFIRLHPEGQVQPQRPVFDPTWDGWQVMTFHAETDADVHADHWEVHTEAEEVVACLAGGIRLSSRAEAPGDERDTEEELKLTPGTAAIVPRNRWHRIQLEAPSDIMSITRPRGSRLKKRIDTP